MNGAAGLRGGEYDDDEDDGDDDDGWMCAGVDGREGEVMGGEVVGGGEGWVWQGVEGEAKRV